MRSKLGFSLIELMVVVGIIAILTTIAIPRFQVFQSKARRTEALSVLNQIHTLQSVYATENAGYYVDTSGTAYGNGGSCNLTNGGTWPGELGLTFACANANFQYVMTVSTTTTFTVVATDTAGVANPAGCIMTINQDKEINLAADITAAGGTACN